MDNQKIVDAIVARIANKIADANGQAAGFGEGANPIAVYEAAGFKSAVGFLMARDDEYRLLTELLAVGQ